MGNNENAIKDFNEAIRIAEAAKDPHYWSYYYLGVSYLKSKYPREALKQLNLANNHDSGNENPGIYDGIAQAYHQLCVYDEAITFYTEAIEKEPSDVDFYCNRARCYYDMKEYEKSAKDLDEALKINGKNSKVHY